MLLEATTMLNTIGEMRALPGKKKSRHGVPNTVAALAMVPYIPHRSPPV